jgi:hypothetical protein
VRFKVLMAVTEDYSHLGYAYYRVAKIVV